MVVDGSEDGWEGGKGSGVLDAKGNRLDGCLWQQERVEMVERVLRVLGRDSEAEGRHLMVVLRVNGLNRRSPAGLTDRGIASIGF